MPELRELRYFQSVARAGNFGRAARELRIGQPNVSHQVQKLETELGTRLLIRHGRGVTLTEAGSSLMARIDTIMDLLNAPLDQAAAVDRAPGTVSIALPSEAAPLLAPRLLAACRARWPSLTISIREGNSASLEEWILERRTDLAVLQDPPALPGVTIDPVLSERLGLVSSVRAAGPDDSGPVRMRQLAGVPLILPDARHWIRRLADEAAFRRGVVFGTVTHAESIPLIKEMVRGELGLAILPLAAVRDETTRGSLSFRAIEHDSLTGVHAIASRDDAAPGGLTGEIGRLLRETMIALTRNGDWVGTTMIARTKAAEAAIS